MSSEEPSYTVASVRRTRRRRMPPTLGSPRAVYELMRRQTRGLDREHFYVILLSTKNTVLSVELVSIGSLNSAIVHPREILKPAIVASAASIVLVHNHPTGDPEPSREDVEFTKRFAQVASLIGIELLDHVVIGDGTYHSLKEAGTF